MEALKALPGIGEKSADRLAYHIIHADKAYTDRLINSITEVKKRVRFCRSCFNLTEQEPCKICRDPDRDQTRVCVVERPSDLNCLEASGSYRGLYHVLHGAISPLDGTGPENLKIQELMTRLKRDKFTELIVATNHNVEGDATAHYLYHCVHKMGARAPKITRLASGIPIGGSLAYADSATLARALAGRGEIG